MIEVPTPVFSAKNQHTHVFSGWMNQHDKPKPATEYRVCQVQLPEGTRCPHFEVREKAT